MSMTPDQVLKKIQILEAKKKLIEELPHLYAFNDYTWSKEFLESRNKICFLTAGNQLGKSTIQLRKMITWATSPDLWPMLWVSRPRQFWYLGPSKDILTSEFETKIKYLLPQGSLKEDPVFGWKARYDGKKISTIEFNSGILWVFKTYSQDVQNLQSGTCDYIGLDEEPPAEIMGELFFRLAASQGYLSAVFTATQGQEYFRLTMEERGTRYEKFPNAAKWQVSRYDCLKFHNGKKSHWTLEQIREDEARCQNQAEIDMRIHGKFVLSEGRKFSEFSIKENVRLGGAIPRDWMIYGAVDYGSGGTSGHPAAICFVAVKHDFTEGRVVRAWRGDGIQTEATDIMMRFRDMKRELVERGLIYISTRYDQSCRDLFTIATRLGEPIQAAEKSHSVGEPIMNSLFRNKMLWLDEEQPEVMKMAFELSSLLLNAPKTRAKDDLADALRYNVTLIPWNWSILNSKQRLPDTFVEPTKLMTEVEERRSHMDPKKVTDYTVEDEMEEWNAQYEQ